MTSYVVRINGFARAVESPDPEKPLLYVLRGMGLTAAKFGCGLGQCGACTAIVGGRAVRSCVTPVGTLAGAEVTTLEGLGTVENPHPIQKAFVDEQAAQCGFCLNGVILTAKAFLDQNPRATDPQIQQALSTILCRCFTHTRMLRAIRQYAQGQAARG
jgi:nicotinate dehydrogenase subunit A